MDRSSLVFTDTLSLWFLQTRTETDIPALVAQDPSQPSPLCLCVSLSNHLLPPLLHAILPVLCKRTISIFSNSPQLSLYDDLSFLLSLSPLPLCQTSSILITSEFLFPPLPLSLFLLFLHSLLHHPPRRRARAHMHTSQRKRFTGLISARNHRPGGVV